MRSNSPVQRSGTVLPLSTIIAITALLAIQSVPTCTLAQTNESTLGTIDADADADAGTPESRQLNQADLNSAASDAEAPSPPPFEEVIITGEQPGPGLWKVTHGGTNVVWVLGTVGGLPKDVKWRSHQVEDVISHAQAVIFGENVSPKISLFRGLLLIRSVLKARFSPDKAMLKDIVTPERYERWLPERAKYFNDDEDIERWRPMFIGMRLAAAAARDADLNMQSSVGRIVAKAAKKYKVPIRNAEVKFDLPNPKQAIRDFTETPRVKDVECFNAVLDNLEPDVEKMKSRAAAWAVGDIEAFRKLPAPVADRVCLGALTSAPALQDEFTKLKEQVVDTWLWEVTKALELNEVTLVVMSLDEVLSPTGRLAKLRERGYTIEAP